MAVPPFQSPHRRSGPSIKYVLPSVWMRAGTSKGLFIHRKDLPRSEAEWPAMLLAAMGSRDGCPRQLDGVGGATSTTSKVAVIGPSKREGCDVDYTFVQIGVGAEVVDLSGNCGNILAGVGPFALDEGLVQAREGETEIDVRIFNTNTGRKIVETISVGKNGKFEDEGDYSMSGVKGTASEIRIAFVDPAGSMTGKLFPTGLRRDWLHIDTPDPIRVEATLCDAANPFVFVNCASMPQIWHESARNSQFSLDMVERIRCEGAVKMGLAKDLDAAHAARGTPKIAILMANLGTISDTFPCPADVSIVAYSMGKLHPSFQLTGAVCLSSAVVALDTVASNIAKRLISTPPETPPEISGAGGVGCLVKRTVNIAHGGGRTTIEVSFVEDLSGGIDIKSVGVSRTARRLFEGNVLFAA